MYVNFYAYFIVGMLIKMAQKSFKIMKNGQDCDDEDGDEKLMVRIVEKTLYGFTFNTT